MVDTKKIQDLTDIGVPASNDELVINDVTGNITKKVLVTNLFSGSAGEVNTAQNVGSGGYGWFKQKSGVILQFRNINTGSNKISLTNDTSNNEIDIDIVEANINHLSIANIGINTHAQIDTAITTFDNNSPGWESAQSTLSNNSAGWESVENTVSNNSTSWLNTDVVNVVSNGSTTWNNATTVLNNNSVGWESAESTLNTNSSGWESTESTVQNNSASWLNTDVVNIISNNSAGWESTESTLSNNSSGWENAESVLNTNSSGWESTETTVSNNSTSWLNTDVVNTVQNNSAGWESVESTVNSNSSGWESAESTLNTNSGSWMNATTVLSNNSAGWESTETTVSNNSASWLNTDVVNTIQNNSAGWESAESTLNTNSTSWVNVESVVNTNSIGWENAESTLNTNSSGWEAAQTTLSNNSVGWEAAETTLSNNSAGWESAKSVLNTNSAGWETAESTLNTNSGDWESVYTTVNNNSASWPNTDVVNIVSNGSTAWNNATTVLNNNSSGWESTESTLNTNSGSWDVGITTLSNNSVGWENAESVLNSNSAGWESTESTVSNNSASWVGVEYAQTRIVAKSGGQYTSIQAAIDNITDATTDNRYAVVVYPGTYTENITMKNYVSLVGLPLRRDTKIYGTSGTLVTLADTECHIDWIDLYMEPTNDSDVLIDATAGAGSTGFYRIENSDITMISSTEGIKPKVVDADVGTGIYFINVTLSYTMSGTTTTGTHTPIYLRTTNKLFYYLRSIARGTINAASGNVYTINDASRGRILVEIATLDATLLNPANTGIAAPIGVFDCDSNYVKQYNNIVVNATGTGSAGNGYSVYLDTISNNGDINCSRNLYNIIDFNNNYRYYVGSGDTALSYFNRNNGDYTDVNNGNVREIDVYNNDDFIISEKVGIGTPTPESQIHIKGSSADIALEKSGGGGSKWVLLSNTNASFKIKNETTDKLVIDSTGNVSIAGNIDASNINDTSWDNVVTVVNNNSIGWENAESVLNTNSAGWEAAESTLNSNSGTWDAAATTLSNNSAGWESAESTLNTNSNTTFRDALSIQDVAIAATVPTDGQVLTYSNASSTWYPEDASGGSHYSEFVIVKTGGTPGTDCDYTTIGAALTAGALNIFVKNGTYTETLTIPNHYTTIIGESKYNTYVNTYTTVFTWYSVDYITIKNLRLYSYANGYPTIFCNRTNYSVIEDCIFQMSTTNGQYCIGFGGDNGGGDGSLTIRNNIFLTSTGDLSGDGAIIQFDASRYTLKGLWIENNTFKCTGGGDIPHCILLSGTNTNLYEAYITGNRFINSSPLATKDCIKLKSNSGYTIKYVNITNNIIETSAGTTDSGITIDVNSGTIDAITITGNTILADSGQHIVLTNSPTNVIDANNNKIV